MNSDAKPFDKPSDKVAAQYKDELIRIGRCSGEERYEGGEKMRDSRFLSLAKERAREIGEQLNDLGGYRLMLQIHGEVKQALGGSAGRELEFAWDGVGEWQG